MIQEGQWFMRNHGDWVLLIQAQYLLPRSILFRKWYSDVEYHAHYPFATDEISHVELDQMLQQEPRLIPISKEQGQVLARMYANYRIQF